MSHPMRILRIDNSAKTETSESRSLTDRIIDALQANVIRFHLVSALKIKKR